MYPYSPHAFTIRRLINHSTKRTVVQMRSEIELEFEVDFEPAVVHQNGWTLCRNTLGVAAGSASSITGTCGQALHIRPYKIKRESIWGWREWWLCVRRDLFLCYRMQSLIDAWKSLRHTLRICHVTFFQIILSYKKKQRTLPRSLDVTNFLTTEMKNMEICASLKVPDRSWNPHDCLTKNKQNLSQSK